MNTKLTLSVEKKIIEQAKKYAANKKTTLSKLVEDYFIKLLFKEKSMDSLKVTDKEILRNAGSISLDKTVDTGELLTDKLMKKYIHD